MSDPIVTRPLLRWHGGKWMLAPWVVEHLPPHRVYTEVFGGAASVLMRKPRSYAEVYNDLDGEVVNLFRVLQDEEKSARLEKMLWLTPFARDEFNLSYELTDDPVERARRLIIVSFMGFGSNGHNTAVRTGFRATNQRAYSTPCDDWSRYPEQLGAFVARMKRVVIENRPAIDVLQHQDSDETLHYVDPPYVHSTRDAGRRQRDYRFEMTDEQHRDLSSVLHSLRGGGGSQRIRLPAVRRTLRDLDARRARRLSRRSAQACRGPLVQREGQAGPG